MSTLTLKKGSKPGIAPGASAGGVQGAPMLPQVNLLPDSVRADRALRRTKLWLLAAIGVVIILALLGYVAAMLSAQSAQDALDVAESEGARLTREQAKYAEVPVVLAQLAATEQALEFGMGSEVLWNDYLALVLGSLPPGAKLTNVETTMATPLVGATTPVDPLTTPGIGAISFGHRSPVVPDTSTWIDSLNAIPGFHDARFSTATISEEDGQVYYEVTTTVEVTAEALSGRFTDKEAEQ